MEDSPLALPIKQEPVDSCSYDGSAFPDVANQEVAGSNKHDFSEPPQEDAGDEYPTHWQAADGLVSIGHAARIKQQIRGRLYVCSECEYQASRADVIKHQRLHTRARPYVCLLCNFAGTQNSHLRSHFKRHHSAPLDEDNHMVIPQSHFICQECQIIFPTQEKLQSHLSDSHTNDEPPSNNKEGENTENTQVDSLQENHVGQPNGALESVKHVNNTVHRDNEQRSPPRSDSCITSKNKISSSSNTLPPTEQRVSTRSAHVTQMLQDDSDCNSKGTRYNSDIAYLQSVFTNNEERQSAPSSKESVENTPSSFTQSNVFEHRKSRAEESPNIEDSLTQQYAVVASSNSSEYKSLAYANDDHVPPSSTCSEGLATVGSGSSSRAKKTFTCSECGYRGGKKDVQKHLTVHTGFRPYVCLQCGHTTAQNNHMRKHFQRIHPGQEAEFDVRTDEFYICSSCLYFFLTHKRFSKHFDMGTCGWPDTSSRSDTVSPNHAIPPNQTLFHLQTTAVNTTDYEDERDIQIPETSYNFSNSLEEGHHPTQRNRQRKNAEPKCAKTNGTTNIPQNAHPDVINLFRRSINIGNNYEELRTEEAMSWSTELPLHEPTRSDVNQQNHASLPSLVETRTRSNKTSSNQEKTSSNSRNRTSRLLQNSTTSASYRRTRSRSHQNGDGPFSPEDPKTAHSSIDDTGAMNSQTVGNAAAVPLHSLSMECSSVDAEQNCDKDVHSTNSDCQSSVPRNIRKAARRSLQKYTQAQKRQRKTYHNAPDNNRSKPIKPFVWHFQGRSYITYEIAGKTSRSLPKDDRQMACNFCPYKTSKKELLRLHMRRHLWMS